MDKLDESLNKRLTFNWFILNNKYKMTPSAERTLYNNIETILNVACEVYAVKFKEYDDVGHLWRAFAAQYSSDYIKMLKSDETYILPSYNRVDAIKYVQALVDSQTKKVKDDTTKP